MDNEGIMSLGFTDRGYPVSASVIRRNLSARYHDINYLEGMIRRGNEVIFLDEVDSVEEFMETLEELTSWPNIKYQ